MISLKELAEKASSNPKANRSRVIVISRMLIEITMNKDAGTEFLAAFNAACGEKVAPPTVRTLNPASRAAVYNEVEAATIGTNGKPCVGCTGGTPSYRVTEQGEADEQPERAIVQSAPVAFDLDFYLTEVAPQAEFTNKDIVAFLATKGIKYELPSRGILPKNTLIERLRKQNIG